MDRGLERERGLDPKYLETLPRFVADCAGAVIDARAGKICETRRSRLGRLFEAGPEAGLDGRRRWRERDEVTRHRADVRVGKRLEAGYDRRHRAAGGAVLGGIAGAEIVEEGLLGPGDWRRRRSIERRREPAIDLSARQMIRPLEFGAQRVARRVAGGAMAEPFDEIGAAIPCSIAIGARLEWLCLMKHGIPHSHQRPEAERRAQLGRAARGRDRGLSHEVRIDRLQVGLARLGEGRVWERREQMTPVASDSLPHRALEGAIGPGPDACRL